MQPDSDSSSGTQLVLASSSPYRRELLERLGLSFTAVAPDIDESPLRDESAAQLAARLSLAKARAVAEQWPRALIIGSDQAATFDGRILGKPGSVEQAVQGLLAFSGRRVDFHTGVAVLHAPSRRASLHVDLTSAHFRCFGVVEARRYVERDRPLDCAGGIRFEGLGPLLLRRVVCEDPSAAIGLPLIKLGTMLRDEGFDPLA